MIEIAYGKRSFAQRQIDVGAQPVAAVYAQALIDAAQAAGKIDDVLVEFDSFISDVLDTNPKFEAILTSAQISPDEKNDLLEKGLGQAASRLFLNFLKVVSRHGRLEILRSIHQAAHALNDRLRQLTRVQVASAAPLDDAMKQRLTDSIRNMLGGTPVLETEVWPELVGGIMMRVGDTVYDGSISTRLEHIRQKMIDRSVHEIQSRRDSFGTSEGN